MACRRTRIRFPLLLLAALAGFFPPDSAGAAEVDELRDENARLRAENQQLRDEIGTLREELSSVTGGEAAARNAPDGSGGPASRVERVFVPRSRVSLEVGRDASGATVVSTPWYRTAETGPLPRKEWILFRARESGGGAAAESWLLLDRVNPRGSLESVGSGRLTIDGRVFDCALVAHDESREHQSVGPVGSTVRKERVRFDLPGEALEGLARAHSARFDAGSTGFDLNDAQLTAASALAARVGRPGAAKPPVGAGGLATPPTTSNPPTSPAPPEAN